MSNVSVVPPDRVDPPAELNKVVNGVCQQCESDDAEEFVSCMFCKISFHMNGCFDISDNDIFHLQWILYTAEKACQSDMYRNTEIFQDMKKRIPIVSKGLNYHLQETITSKKL